MRAGSAGLPQLIVRFRAFPPTTIALNIKLGKDNATLKASYGADTMGKYADK